MKGGAAFVVLLSPLTSCVLADPPPTLPPPAEGPPTILEGVTPEAAQLTSWPNVFVIPVSVVDPTEPLEWIALEFPGSTYPSNMTPTILPHNQPVVVTPGVDAGTVFAIHADGFGPPLGTGCFTVQVIVAYGFNGVTPTTPPGGSVATWTWSGSGDFDGCNAYDASSLADGTFPDALPPEGGGG